MVFFVVSSATELAEIYQKKVNELTAKGWDQAKFQVILDWYQVQNTQLAVKVATSPSVSNTAEDTFPNGIFLIITMHSFFFLVTNVSDAAAEYKKRVEDLTAKGWDQVKFQKILDWYQNTTTRLASSPSTATTSPSTVTTSSEDTFPNGYLYIIPVK